MRCYLITFVRYMYYQSIQTIWLNQIHLSEDMVFCYMCCHCKNNTYWRVHSIISIILTSNVIPSCVSNKEYLILWIKCYLVNSCKHSFMLHSCNHAISEKLPLLLVAPIKKKIHAQVLMQHAIQTNNLNSSNTCLCVLCCTNNRG